MNKAFFLADVTMIGRGRWNKSNCNKHFEVSAIVVPHNWMILHLMFLFIITVAEYFFIITKIQLHFYSSIPCLLKKKEKERKKKTQANTSLWKFNAYLVLYILLLQKSPISISDPSWIMRHCKTDLATFSLWKDKNMGCGVVKHYTHWPFCDSTWKWRESTSSWCFVLRRVWRAQQLAGCCSQSLFPVKSSWTHFCSVHLRHGFMFEAKYRRVEEPLLATQRLQLPQLRLRSGFSPTQGFPNGLAKDLSSQTKAADCSRKHLPKH